MSPSRKWSTRSRRYLFAAIGLALTMAMTGAPASADNQADFLPWPQPTPVDYDDYLVFMANGSYNFFEPHPTVPGCSEMFCDGMYFQERIMRRSPAEIAEQERLAIEHFDRRFDIDVHDPANAGRIEFRPFMADPRWNYRVYNWGGRYVPKEGYEIRDGGWGVWITDPAGYTLGGEMDGVHVAQGAFVFYGDYNILVPRRLGQPREEFVISYRGDTFMDFNQFGDMAFSCQVSTDGFEKSAATTGYAQGFTHMAVAADGWLDLNIRNVMTFGQAEFRR